MADPTVSLIEIGLYFHGAILAGAGSAFLAYSDRTDGHVRSLTGAGTARTELLRRITSELITTVEPLFDKPSPVAKALYLPSESGQYAEQPVNILTGETFREKVREFVDSQSTALVDYRSLSLSLTRWCLWCHRMSISLLILLVLQLAICAVFYLAKTNRITLPELAIYLSAVPTLLLLVYVIIAVFCRLRCYRSITHIRVLYGEL